MFVVSVTIFVKPQFLAQFIEATMDNAKNTRLEPGNVRFDVLQAEADPNRFLLYEAYKTPDGFVRHQEAEHYLRWKKTVSDFMAEPRQGVKHNAVFFNNDLV